MRYSARQLYCLQAMGIVPWVPRFGQAETVCLDGQPSAAAMEVTEVAEPVAETPPESAAASAIAPVPLGMSQLGAWLQRQTLAAIDYRGSLHPVLGVAEAPLLVVLVQRDRTPSAGTMAGDDGSLFELMLRSIELSNRDTRRCLIGDPMDVSRGVDIDSLCSRHTRGVLVLMDPWTIDATRVSAREHMGRLPGNSLPLWRMAHPAVLLAQPQLKRQAWHVLKSVRAMLDGKAQA